MYLHIGNNYSVNPYDVVGIFDIENTTTGKFTKKFLERAEKNHLCIYATYEMPKSFIVTVKNGMEKVYISQLSAYTLKKRLNG
ncbi:MAG: DUF370 domain-containing protein [Prevotella sp.]|nr:DUF370 domain-containing protein [Alistipes senegalensis]MCM1358216.1 DUF370 domain-containing protein [Prevotella sp.]MCM1473444.1 DUF370 domain-containing protein [Muribaculaceae bacterium]MDE6425532.1 DUF370 domain-containing protein [Ruminococcus sp.]